MPIRSTGAPTPSPAAFIANQVLGRDLPADATSDETGIVVDSEALGAQVLSTFRALGPLAYSADAIASGSATASVSDLSAPRDVGDGAVESNGRYSFEVTFDPGDGIRTRR